MKLFLLLSIFSNVRMNEKEIIFRVRDGPKYEV